MRVWPSLPMSRKIVFEINHIFLHYLQLLIPTELTRTTEKPQKGGFYQSNRLKIQCNRIHFYLFAKNKPFIQYFPAFVFSYFAANDKGNILKLLEIIMKRCVLIFSGIIVLILTASKLYLQDASVVFKHIIKTCQ